MGVGVRRLYTPFSSRGKREKRGGKSTNGTQNNSPMRRRRPVPFLLPCRTRPWGRRKKRREKRREIGGEGLQLPASGQGVDSEHVFYSAIWCALCIRSQWGGKEKGKRGTRTTPLAHFEFEIGGLGSSPYSFLADFSPRQWGRGKERKKKEGGRKSLETGQRFLKELERTRSIVLQDSLIVIYCFLGEKRETPDQWARTGLERSKPPKLARTSRALTDRKGREEKKKGEEGRGHPSSETNPKKDSSG